MKAAGIIVEYNPFHNGHVYHAQQARMTSNADVIIAVMSGNFLQRGEPAFIDKWARAKMALQNGVDLIFELPYVFATAHAPAFADGAIQLLDAARCQSYCFGSEEGDIKPFENSISLIEQAGDAYELAVKDAITRGLSYPKALNEAYNASLSIDNTNQTVADLSKPNNILGFHYMQAAENHKSHMQAVTIPRVVANYYDDAIIGNTIASATGIRKSYFESENIHSVNNFIPSKTTDELQQWATNRHVFGCWSTFYPHLRFTILRDGPVRLAEIADITEGIENLMYRAAQKHDTFDGFMNEVKSKRYTWTRIQRMLTHIFTGFTYAQRESIKTPNYLRLLGMTKAGQRYLNQMKKQLTLPLVSKVANFQDPSLRIDVHAANMYALGISSEKNKASIGTDYNTAPIIMP